MYFGGFKRDVAFDLGWKGPRYIYLFGVHKSFKCTSASFGPRGRAMDLKSKVPRLKSLKKFSIWPHSYFENGKN